MRVSTLIKRLQEVKEKHGDIMVAVNIDNPTKDIIENVQNEVVKIEELNNFYEEGLYTSMFRSVENNLKIQGIWSDANGRRKNYIVLTLS